jgi:hypothetical protein
MEARDESDLREQKYAIWVPGVSDGEHCALFASRLCLWLRLLVPVIEPTVRSLTLHRHANLLLAAASVFLLQSHPHPILNQMENGTLLSLRFEFPRPLLAADRTQICYRSLLLTSGQRRNQV